MTGVGPGLDRASSTATSTTSPQSSRAAPTKGSAPVQAQVHRSFSQQFIRRFYMGQRSRLRGGVDMRQQG